ncbi:uncharacterized protein LOC124825276 [Vigna umbellata]|uniref:uncharacterized protein LOC124825276 n=1 Tax=Vigna umbellata TaxID=87088 RepID=UPI001F5F70AF|nr:uncharacterized protein LOC124825276 [Vigna umbellata]
MKNVENKDASNSETFAKSKLHMEHDVRDEFGLPSFSKKRKKREDTNDQLPSKGKKKVFRPKLVSQIPKRRKKSQVKSKTPKPSTPEQRENNIRRGGSCERQLFDEDSSNASNEIGIQHNSVQSYHKMSSLSGLCLLKEKQIGSEFPFLFKKKRVLKRRLHLLKLLTPVEKRRSKWFTRKRRQKVDFSVDDSNFKNKMLINRIKKFSSLMKKGKSKKINELDNCKDSGKLVLYKKSALNDSLLDEETSRVWNLLKQEKGHDENDEMKRKYWENIRKIYQCKVESFIDHMHFIQGDRRFLPWKGSVLDSVVGVFLTQNVADYLSSSAFMSLASNEDYMDSVDWEAVRVAKPREVAQTIAARGQHNIIGERIQDLLKSLMESNGSLDLEWLRYAPPKHVKEYLLAIGGLGLKSVECIRLLALHHTAFPVDINVARIVVRLDEFGLPSFSKKRKKREDTNDQLPSKGKKKVFRPKLVSQIPKRRKKSQVKSKTPKPSTPEQRENNIRRGGSCERQLFDEDSSNASNEIGIQHNSVQSYHKMSSLSGLCLLKEKQIGSEFPFLFKKKRVLKRRLHLLKFLTPVEKRRSKWFTRKRRQKVDFSVDDSNFKNKMLINRIKKFSSLMKKGKSKKINELDNCKDSGKLVLYKKSALNDSLLDEETSRVWNLLKQEKGHDENDEMKRKYWENIRKIYQCKVESFIDHMHFIQGDRRFLPWKGSVLDSVVGVFLTQNVADYLSSSAFMSLASKFSLEKKERNLEKEEKKDEKEEKEDEKENKEDEKENKEDEDKNESSSIKIDDKGTTNGRSEETNVVDEKKSKGKKTKEEEEEMRKKRKYWDLLRKIYTKNYRSEDYMDSVDWEAVRVAKPREVAQTIAARGQHNIIGERIQDLLKSLMESNGSLDLEWLRYAPPKHVKEYLLAIGGLGLKSVECIRLLALHHTAFPVDINVARIVVRLGWVPIQPLPEYIQIHNLEVFPDSDKIQQYLWPRLCTLDPPQLYELHYQLITFGKVFCTKQKPNCNACPLKSDCKYFASAFSREKLALPESKPDYEDKTVSKFALPEPTCLIYEPKRCEPTIELPTSPEHVDDCKDIEDISKDYYNSESKEDISLSKAIITSYADHIPMQKMKDVSRLKTERLVYVLPDNHPLLSAMQCEQRQTDDPCPYLLIVWDRGELEDSCESNLDEEANTLTIPATLLIPCRSAMRSRFPLNGTYFQVNEVFVDYASMIHPINVPRKWLWNLDQRIVYIGTTVSSIMRGLSLGQIQDCFWNGFVCVRAFDVKTRAPRPISEMLHRNTTAKLRKGELEDSCESNLDEEANTLTIPATLLIPCRSAMRSRFPLNGTYFQVNEVFVDYASMIHPINVPRKWLWNLDQRIVYIGTTVSSIMRGFVCVRAFDVKTRAPRPISEMLHRNTTAKLRKGKGTKK